MCLSCDGPLQKGHAHETICTVFELTSDEPFVVANQEGFFGSCCIVVNTKLFQDAVLTVEDDLPYPTSTLKNYFDFDDLLVCWEVEAVVIVLISACSASLPVTQSESESGNTVLKPLNLGDRKVSDLLQGHRSNTT